MENPVRKIQVANAVRITTVEEAMAYLNSIGPVMTQIAAVLQKTKMYEIAMINREMAAANQPKAEAELVKQEAVQSIPDVVPTEVPQEEIEDKEEFAPEEIKSKVEALKKAKK